MTIEEFTTMPLTKRLLVAKKIAQSAKMPPRVVKRRLNIAAAAFDTHQHELPLVAIQILVELDRVKEL